MVAAEAELMQLSAFVSFVLGANNLYKPRTDVNRICWLHFIYLDGKSSIGKMEKVFVGDVFLITPSAYIYIYTNVVLHYTNVAPLVSLAFDWSCKKNAICLLFNQFYCETSLGRPPAVSFV